LRAVEGASRKKKGNGHDLPSFDQENSGEETKGGPATNEGLIVGRAKEEGREGREKGFTGLAARSRSHCHEKHGNKGVYRGGGYI